MPDIERYRSFVEHPRYGRQPRFTGLNPQTDFDNKVFLHWDSPVSKRIPNTAIAADLNRQLPATVPVTHYFDTERKCRDCGRMFIFFAAEQRFWYEELQFPLEVQCVRCAPCRKTEQGIARTRKRYEELFHERDRSTDQDLEMAECSLDLMEHGLFPKRQTERVRALLNRSGDDDRFIVRVASIRDRLREIESSTAAISGPRRSEF